MFPERRCGQSQNASWAYSYTYHICLKSKKINRSIGFFIQRLGIRLQTGQQSNKKCPPFDGIRIAGCVIKVYDMEYTI
jgi:hypothetical protein